MTPTKAQIGKAGELLVQQKLLMFGIESARITTDTGIDLVAYSPHSKTPVTIQVKTTTGPSPGGGKGKDSIGWRMHKDNPAEAVALVDLSESRVWIMKKDEFASMAQQNPETGFDHLFMFTDHSYIPQANYKKYLTAHFTEFLLENNVERVFNPG